ncbi:type II toxin-antitoxin system VapC family toxin [Candidatus Woesearchaeota archaeon]|nr:type II toxin-antitoxin system VapC family toxin [Candidatus Woesearchaeota archaeon]
MGNPLILDTDFIIEFIKGREPAVTFVQQEEENTLFATTTINAFELYVGAQESPYKEKNSAKLHEFINQLLILPLTLPASRKAAEIHGQLKKQGSLIDIKGLLIGAIALEEGFALKTNNKKHFSRIPGLEVL